VDRQRGRLTGRDVARPGLLDARTLDVERVRDRAVVLDLERDLAGLLHGRVRRGDLELGLGEVDRVASTRAGRGTLRSRAPAAAARAALVAAAAAPGDGQGSYCQYRDRQVRSHSYSRIGPSGAVDAGVYA